MSLSIISTGDVLPELNVAFDVRGGLDLQRVSGNITGIAVTSELCADRATQAPPPSPVVPTLCGRAERRLKLLRIWVRRL